MSNTLTEFFVIRNSDGEYYKPTPYGNFWKSSQKKAKVYTNIGHAKCAITTKMEHYENMTNSEWLNPSKEDLQMYSKFKGCQIVKIAFMHPISNEIVRYTQGKD